jgi:hypothetical protein
MLAYLLGLFSTLRDTRGIEALRLLDLQRNLFVGLLGRGADVGRSVTGAMPRCAAHLTRSRGATGAKFG